MNIHTAGVRLLAAISAGLVLLGCSSPPASQAEPDDIVPVNPDEYASPGAQNSWRFYTDSNINCGIGGKYLTCIASPSDGLPGSKENNLVWATDTSSLLTWSATQAKPWGPPAEPFQANRKGEKLLPPGHSITVPDGSCTVTADAAIECRKASGHGFVIDSAGTRAF
ncbi:hypothetical protein DDJ48_01725 [Mycobacteroides abscessus]|nr:hypothetical protein DDJ48_01725 [Mycobacteroides abscessus]RIT93282.1 hypothetical protein D2F00_20980 [Mycobacteroides abscessus]